MFEVVFSSSYSASHLFNLTCSFNLISTFVGHLITNAVYKGCYAPALLFNLTCLFNLVTAIAEMIRGVGVDTSYRSPNTKGTRACVSIASNIYTALFSPLESPFALTLVNAFTHSYHLWQSFPVTSARNFNPSNLW